MLNMSYLWKKGGSAIGSQIIIYFFGGFMQLVIKLFKKQRTNESSIKSRLSLIKNFVPEKVCVGAGRSKKLINM